MMRYVYCLTAAVALLVQPVLAQEYKAGDIVVKQVFARATAPGARTGGAFLKLENKGKTADRLLRASSPAAEMAELHTMTMEGDVMRMRGVEAIEIKPGASVTLAPGGLHVMLMNLKQPLKEGGHFPLTLVFERAGSIQVDVAVQSVAAQAMPGHMQMH